MFFEQREQFMADLVKDIKSTIKFARKHNLIPVFRLNGTSDISWHKVRVDGYNNIFEAFPDIQFYDYTKVHRKPLNIPNYHQTFSKSECNRLDVAIAIANGQNVAVVFDGVLPTMYHNRPVIDGTETDLRFLDPKGVIVGLVTKGWNANKKRAVDSGFAVRNTEGMVAFCDQ
jgi:hypothetical protein